MQMRRILKLPDCVWDRMVHPKLAWSLLTNSEYGRWDFPDDPVVKSLSCNAEDVSLISGRGTKTLRVMEQLSEHATLTEPLGHD